MVLRVLLVTFFVAASAQAQTARGVVVSGVVQDQTAAVIPSARVSLTGSGDAAPRVVVTDAAGAFRFERILPGTYEIRAEFPGFQPTVLNVRVGNRTPAPVTIALAIEGLTQEVSVSGGGARTSADAAANLNSITVDENTLDDLPVLDQDIVGTMSRFLDSSAIGTGGTTILVDGVEVNALALSASAVQQIKINQDPYAAEFMRPGRGRIEIITKPGGRDVSGTLNLRFRDSDLSAQNAFAAVKPPEQRRIVEGTLGGPVPRTGKTNFLLSGVYDAEDNQSIVVAQQLSGEVRENVATPFRNRLLAGSVSHQQGDRHTVSFRYSHVFTTNTNQGVGGVTLPEVGTNRAYHEDEATYTQQTVISDRLLNDVKFMFGVENEPRTSVRPDPRVIVLDAFVGGGAQNDSLRTEHHFTLVEAVTWSPGRHVVKAGINIPDWSWRGYDDRTNTGGTFSFSSLADYAARRPYQFTQQVGNGHVAFLEKVLGLFVQDEVRLRPNLSLDLGLRYDWQNYFHDADNFAPRFSFAYAPDEQAHTVIRGGAGVFYDRTGPGPIQDILRYDGAHLLRYVLLDPGFPVPLQSGQTLASQPVSTVQLAPDVTIPYTVQYSAGVERQLRPKTTLAVTFIGSRGVDLFRSRDINAPVPPGDTRPDPTRGVVRQIESAGKLNAATLQLTLRGQLTRWFNGSAEYSFGRAYNDTSGVNWMPPNAYDLSLEYARADFNQRHRLEMFGAVNAGHEVTIGASVSLATGRPYSIVTGTDDFHTGSANARPLGVPRNSLDGPGYADLDLRCSREFVVSTTGARKRTVTAGIDAFNVLNRVNYSFYVGTLSSPFFVQAISAQPPRRLQLSLRVHY